jgi:hypothetical protein
MRHLIIVGLIALVAPTACDDHSYRRIGAAIDVLTERTPALPGPAIERLRKVGKPAVPQIETAMHTASPHGKLNLITALEAIGEPESAAILQHFAVYDASSQVREACEKVLAKWAAGKDSRTQPAKLAIARIAEKRRLGQTE